jgi:hypothetical protein
MNSTTRTTDAARCRWLRALNKRTLILFNTPAQYGKKRRKRSSAIWAVTFEDKGVLALAAALWGENSHQRAPWMVFGPQATPPDLLAKQRASGQVQSRHRFSGNRNSITCRLPSMGTSAISIDSKYCSHWCLTLGGVTSV